MQAPTIPLVETQAENPPKEQSNIVHLHSVADQSALQVERTHTISSIAADCKVSRDQAKYAHKKATKVSGELGQILEGTRYFSDDEKAEIIASGKLTDLTVPSADEVKAQAVEVEILIPGSVLSKYRSELAVYETTLPTKSGDNTEIVEFYVTETEKLGKQSTRFENLLSDVELQECIRRGNERGALKALLERNAEQQSYQKGMTGSKPEEPVAPGTS